MIGIEKIEILNTPVSCVGIDELSSCVRNSINASQKILITYAHFHTLNNNFISKDIKANYNCFDIIHADGIGVYLASHFLYGKNGLKKRITGSDFYPELVNEAIKNKWRVFFWGDTDDTLKRIPNRYKNLNLAGMQNGFDYNEDELIKRINSSEVDILVVGIGGGRQERWIAEHYQLINAKVILAVGEGIKVFADYRHRGPKFMRDMGLEWMIRLFFDHTLWKRYFYGIPLFCFRIISQKYFQRK